MNQSPSMERLFDAGSYQQDLYSSALGWEVPGYFLLKKAIVISVKLGVDTSDQTAAFLPQYSINGRIIGEDTSSLKPENDIPQWFIPFCSSSIISIPEVGEQVLIMLETLRSDSRAYWIGRVNDCDHLSLKLAYQQNASSNPMPLSRYGMPFDVSNIHARSKQASAYNNNPVFQIPGKLGDVIMQGRNGSYLRHTYNPQSGRTGKPGLLEMGILANKVYEPNNLSSTVGDTKTKTVHFSDTLLSTLGAPFIKKTPNTNDFIETPLQDIPDIQNQGSDVLRETKRNFIVNMANEIYNVSNTIDSERSMYRQVLGEKLNEHLKKQDDIIREMTDILKGFVSTIDILFESYVNHVHNIPEINIDIPDKEVSFDDRINLGIRMIPQPDLRVFVPAQTVAVPGSGATTVTNTVQTPAGPRTYTEEIAGTPGSTVTIPSKFIDIPQPDKAENKGYRVTKRTRKIEYDKINIGGAANPRNTTTIETDRQTDRVQNDLNDIKDNFDSTKEKFINLTKRLDLILSSRQFIN